jgi:predicted MFS family arabinose efflux permease
MRLAITCGLLALFGFTTLNGSRVGVSLAALAIDGSPLLMGALMACYSLMPMLLALPAGRLIDRLGLRRPLATSFVLIGAGTVLPALWPSVPALFAAALSVGSGALLMSLSLNNAVGTLSPPAERTRNFAFYTIGMSGSNALGPAAAGFAIDATGFAGAFLLLACASLVALLIFAREGHLFSARSVRKPARSGGYLELLLDPRMRVIYIVNALLTMIWDVYQFVIPLYGSRIGLSASQIGIILATFSAATFCVRVLMPVLVRHFRDWSLVAATLALAGVGYLYLPAAGGFGTLVATGILLGGGFGFANPIVLSISYALSPPGREGEVAGVRSSVASAFHFGFPLVLGALTATLGIAPLVWTVSALMFGGVWYVRRQPSHQSNGAA